MPLPPSHSGTLTLLMERLNPVSDYADQTIVLNSKPEYDLIPWHWQFRCHGAVFQLKRKSWSDDGQGGTATFRTRVRPE